MSTVAAPEIEHGTPRGYRQHRARKVPYCEPCRVAIREYNREARRTATQAQVAWNKGLTGEPEARETRPVGRDCVTPGCGQLAELPQPAAHMVRVEEPGSREPARWYCAQSCAGYGQALAEIRAIP